MLMMICCGIAERGWLDASWGSWTPTSRSSSLKRVAMRKNIRRKKSVSIRLSRLIGSSVSASGSLMRMQTSHFRFRNRFVVRLLRASRSKVQEMIGEVDAQLVHFGHVALDFPDEIVIDQEDGDRDEESREGTDEGFIDSFGQQLGFAQAFGAGGDAEGLDHARDGAQQAEHR